MPIATRTFRVFVSSTFEDLKEERDALQHDVFPKLRTLCEQHGARFQAIDLRWGVRDEAGLDQQTMEICLREIERCKCTGIKPNFIVLLGARYGWEPLPPGIPASEFAALRLHIPPGEVLTSADQWYRLDENAIPPKFCLQPRTGEFVDPAAWKKVEEMLHPALALAARTAALPARALLKYEASATHQEILTGLGESGADRQHVFGFFRRPSDGETNARLEDLKSYLRVQLPGNIEEFDRGETTKLCNDVLTRLRSVIEAEVKSFKDLTALDLEVESHNRFAEERCRVFTGRESVLDTIAEYLRADDRRPLVLRGESGSGKSAVMAKASKQYQGPGRMIRRFIGASPQSASGHALLTSLCLEIAPGDTPVDYAQLENAFKERLKMASAEQPLVVFIDALDQLSASDPAREATWLPSALPLHVKVIVSTTDDGKRLPEALLVQLERMGQPEGGEALDELLREARRTLQPWQRETVLTHFERCGLPLYLKLAAEESRLWKSYMPVDDCALGEGIAGVIDTLFARLSSNANHGPVLVQRSLAYLAAARYGLAEDEILDVLTEDDAVWNDFNDRKHHEVSERRLPVVVWSRLSLDLEPYLTERAAPGGTVTTFFHRQLAECVAARFLAGIESQLRHTDLARHFATKPTWMDAARTVPNVRRAVELPFQQRSAGQWLQAEETLFDAQFLFAKVAAGLVLDLDADYEALLDEAPESAMERREAQESIRGALRLSMHVVERDSAQFAPQMVGRLLVHQGKPEVSKFVDEITTAAPRPWIRPLHPCLDAPGGLLLRTLRGHSFWVSGVVVTPDGKLAVSSSEDRTLRVWSLETGREMRKLEGHSNDVNGVAVTPDGKLAVSASSDNTLIVWGLDSGCVLRRLEGHTATVNGVVVTPDGKCAISTSHDKTLKVWDLGNGRELRTLEGHVGPVCCVAVTPNGKLAVSGSWDLTLKVWDLDTGREVRTLEGHAGPICSVALTPDGKRVVSASEDATLELWDLDTGQRLRRLDGHADSVYGVVVTPDGARAISASRDKTLKVWDLGTGVALYTLEGHSAVVRCVAVSPNGRLAVSASEDKLLKVWNLNSGQALRAWEGHSDSINGVALTLSGKRVISASQDKMLKVWDLDTGQALRTLQGHSSFVYGVAATANGKLAVSASDDRTLIMWDLEIGRAVRTLEGHSDQVNGVAVTADGKRAVSASYDDTLKVWDLETGVALRTLEGHSDDVNGVAVTVDGERAVSASWDQTLKVWNLETGRVLHTLEGHFLNVCGVAVTNDGKRAVSASWDQTLKVWNLETGGAVLTLEGHSLWVLGTAVTPSGKRAISVSEDKTLRVWDLNTGVSIAAFHCEAAACCCACADERRIIAGDESGRMYFLALEE